MTTRRAFLSRALVISLVGPLSARAAGIPAAETAKIESLIADIEGLAGAKFIRNGETYDARTAGKFLRGKWHANEKAIHSAADFIEVAATRSSTTGKPYLIQLKGAAPALCADYLGARLKKLETAKAR